MYNDDFRLQPERCLDCCAGRSLVKAHGLVGHALVFLDVAQDELALVDGVPVDPGFWFEERKGGREGGGREE